MIRWWRTLIPLHAHRKASGRATPTRETPQKVCTAPCESFMMQCMVTAPIPLYSPNDITRAQSHAGDWIASFDFDGACTSTPSLPTIASTNESPSDSSKTTSTLTGPFCCNHQYSVTAITTSTGAIAERYAYTAYGQPMILNAAGTPFSPQTSTLNSRYSYTGREWDATLGLHHFRARWMSPNAGRFLSRDPIDYEGSQWGLYDYVAINPLVNTDPAGLGDSVSEYYKKCMEKAVGKKNPVDFCRCMCAPIAPVAGKNCEKDCLNCMTNFSMGPCKCLCRELTTNKIDERRCFEACEKNPEKPTCSNMFPFLPVCGTRAGFGGGLQATLVPGSIWINEKPSSWCPGGTHHMYKERKSNCPFSILSCPCCGPSKTNQPSAKEECKLTQQR